MCIHSFYGNQQYVATSSLKIPEYYSKWELPGKKQTIRNSIKRYGIKSPLVVNENPKRANIIVHGVTVFTIAEELGIEEVPVMYVDLDMEEEQQLRILLDQKGSLELSQDEIIQLIGRLEYETFFTGSMLSDTLSKHIIEAEKKVAADPPKPKNAIKQLLIRLTVDDDAALRKAKQEMGAKTLSDTVKILLATYNETKK